MPNPTFGIGAGMAVSSGMFDEDEQERRRTESLRRATISAETSARQGFVPVTKTLAEPDQPTSIMRSIHKVGGTDAYSRRVNQLAAYYRSKFGVDPDPAFILDIARLPLPFLALQKAMSSVTGFYRGLGNDLQRDEAERWQKSGMVPTAKPKGTKARAVEEEGMRQQEERRMQDNLPAPVRRVLGDRLDPDPVGPVNPYWQVRRGELEYEKAKEYAEIGWTPKLKAPPSPGEHALTEVGPIGGISGLIGLDVRRGGIFAPEGYGGDFGASLVAAASTRADREEPAKEEEPFKLSAEQRRELDRLNKEYGRSASQTVALPEADARKAGLDFTVVVETPVGRIVAVNAVDLMAAGRSAHMAALLTAVTATAPQIYGALNKFVNSGVSLLEWMDDVKDKTAWFAHAAIEYDLTGKVSVQSGSQGVPSKGIYVKAYNPDGSAAYVTASASMTEEEMLKVLEIQGTKFHKNADGTLTIDDPGKPKDAWSWEGFKNTFEYADWLSEKKVSMGTPFVSGTLTDIGYIDEPKEGDTIWDFRRLVGLAGDLAFYSAGDVAFGGGIRAGLRLSQVDRLISAGVRKSGLLKTVAQAVSESEDVYQIMAVTGIRDPKVAAKFADVSSVDEVTTTFREVLQDGVRIDPASFMVRNRLKFAVSSSEDFRKLPRVMQQAFNVLPDNPRMLPVADWDIFDTVTHVGNAFNAPYEMTSKWANKILRTADRDQRAGYLAQMWDDLASKVDPATYRKAEKRAAKYAAAGGKDGLLPPNLHYYAPDPETEAEISKRRMTDVIADAEADLARQNKKLELLKQLELYSPAKWDELKAKGAMEADDVAWSEDYIKAGEEFIKNLEDEHKLWEESYFSEKAIRERQRLLRDTDTTREIELEALRELHDMGGISYRNSPWDQRLSNSEIMRLLHGRYSSSNPYSLWNERGGIMRNVPPISPDRAAKDFANARPDLANLLNIHDSDGLYDFLQRVHGRKGRATLADYYEKAVKDLSDEAESVFPASKRELQQENIRTARESLDLERKRLAAHKQLLGTNQDYRPFYAPANVDGTILSESARAQELEGVEAKIRGLSKRIEDMRASGDLDVPVPLFDYQLRQYWNPPIPLDLLAATYSGPAASALDALQRGVVLAKSQALKAGGAGAGSAMGAGTAYSMARAQGATSEEAAYAAVAGAALGTAVGAKVGMKWAKGLEKPDALMKVTPNLDLLTNYWKRYALGSVGVLFRIAGDEPARMASRGYGATALQAWFKNSNIQKSMMKDGWYLGPYSYEKGMTQLAYLMDNVHPQTFVVFGPHDDGWERAFATSVKILQAQPTTKMFTRALKEGEDPMVAIGRYFKAHPDSAKMLAEHRGTSIERAIEQEVEYLTKFTHRRVQSTGKLGLLDEAKSAEWEAYRAGTGAKPAWLNDVTDRVIKEGGSGDYVHLRQQSQLFGFLSGDRKLVPREIKALAPEVRPHISARRPRGAIVAADGHPAPRTKFKGPIDTAYDGLYGRFDAVMRNVRSNIYLREYKWESEGLRRLATERGIAANDDMIHQLADRKAQSMVDHMTYTSQRTGLENLLRDFVPFLPATRDFMAFWAAEAVRRPSRLAAFMRLNTEVPDQVKVEWDEDSMYGLGRVLTTLTAATEFTFNPRALTFFTGGAMSPVGEGGGLWQYVESQFPGLGPSLTIPAHYLARDFPDKFGPFPAFFGVENSDLTKIPGLELVAKEMPLFSRAERFVWAAVATLGGYDTAQTVTKGWSWLSRDTEARDRLVDAAMRYVLYEEGKAGVDPRTLSEDEQKDLIAKAKNRIARRESATGFLGFLMPAIPYFKDREEEDVKHALGAYRDTYNAWENFEGADEISRKAGLMQARVQARADQRKVRAKYPEYEGLFDYVDAMAEGDEDKFAKVSMEHPEVVGYFQSMYNDHGDIEDWIGIETGDAQGVELWMMERDYGLHPVKNPNAYAAELFNAAERSAGYAEASAQYKDLLTNLAQMGMKPTDAEYKEAVSKFKKGLPGGEGTLTPPRKLGWLSGEELGDGEDPNRVAYNNYQTEVLKAEYQEAAANQPSEQGKALLKADYTRRMLAEGLDPKKLDSDSGPVPQEVRERREVMADITKDPWKFATAEEFEAHGITYDDSLVTAQAEATDAHNKMVELVKEHGGSFWDKKYAGLRDSYQNYIRSLCDSSPAFASFWEYYQSQNWEKMQASGRYQSKAWTDWFDAMAQRDYLVDQKVASGVLRMNDPSNATAKLVDSLLVFAEELKASDPAFATEFDAISLSFWNKERRW